MERLEEGRNTNIRPTSLPNIASRAPSLHRQNSDEFCRPSSLPAENLAGSGWNSVTTFATIVDDVQEYPMRRFEGGGTPIYVRPRSEISLAQSFNTRDSRVFGGEYEINRSSEQLVDRQLLAEGQTNLDDHYRRQRPQQHDMYSGETLALYPPRESSLPPNSRLPVAPGTPKRSFSRLLHEPWCTCDENDVINQVKNSSTYVDLEAQTRTNATAKLHPPEKAKKGSKGPGGAGGPPGGGPPGLPPFPPGFPDDLKVTFNGPDDQLNPKNWPARQKWATTACTASFTFLSPLASSMIAPALADIQKDFQITNPLETQITLSIFVLAYAIGPMFLAPLSELYGRVIISQSSNVFFLVFNTLCGFAQSKYQLMAFRFLAGLGGSAPLAMGGGVLGDIFKPEERGKAMGLYAMGPLLGPAIGPLIGGWVAEKSTWRWMFWATSMVNVIVLACGFVWFKETYAPYLLHKKAKKLREETGNPNLRAPGEEDLHMPVIEKVSRNMTRAFGMLFTQPIVQVMAVYMGFSYGILYLMLSTYPLLWKTQYGQSTGMSGLNYISLGLGFFIGAPACGKTSDAVYKKLKARAIAATPKGKPAPAGKPEYRMPVVICFSFFVPIGLFIYGWSAQVHAFWLIPNVGAFIFGIGTIAAFQCVTSYLVDTFARFAASAVAAVTVLRSLMGFAFPIFAPAMYNSLGFGWGNTVLALAAIGIGIPTPIILWLVGEKLRKRSTMAQQAKKGPGSAPPGKGVGGGPADSRAKQAMIKQQG